MRNLIITREKTYVARLITMKVYIEDSVSGDTKINGVLCRKLGTLKNGEQKSFPIDDTAARVFVIADKLSKGFCNEFFDVPAGTFDVAIKGKNHYNPFAGNPFRFEGVDNEEVLANRKKMRKRSYIVMAIALVVGVVLGVVSGLLDSDEITPKTFSKEEMSITLTSEFMYFPQEDFTACYGTENYTVLVSKDEFSYFEEVPDIYGYAELVIADPAIETVDYEGFISFEYTGYGDDGTEYSYFATVFETEDAFWLIQFASETEKYEEILPTFVEWAKTVTFE